MAECNCNTNSPLPMPKDIVDLKTPLYHACGGRLYRLNLEIDASSIMMGGQDVATRINSLERALQANTSTHFADTIAQRNQLGGLVAGDYCYVFDASADPTVGKGPAMYIWMPGNRWVKLYNGESPIDCVNLIAPGGGLAIDASGKIYVDFSKAPATTIRQITSYIYKNGGGLAVDGDGRLFVDLSALVAPKGGLKVLADRLAVNAGDIITPNAGLATDADGRLRVDFSAMPAEQMRAVVLSMVQSGGGLGVDASGRLYVDFASMPTDKFDAMLKSLRLPIWLTANTDFYVDGGHAAASDTLDSGRGLSAAKPFRTIQACANYVANNYNVGNYRARILVADGTYPETLSLPDFSRNGGYIEIAGKSGNRNNCVVQNVNPRASTVNITGGNWVLSRLAIDFRPNLDTLAENMASAVYTALVNISAGVCSLYGNLFTFVPSGAYVESEEAAPLPQDYRVRMAAAGGSGRLNFRASEIRNRMLTSIPPGRDKVVIFALLSQTGSDIVINGSDNDSYRDGCGIESNAIFDVFAYASGGHIFVENTWRHKPAITNEATAAGRRYTAVSGGQIDTSGTGGDCFPGALAGVAEASTYSWYK